MEKMFVYKIQEMNDHEFFEAVNQDPLFKALAEYITDGVTFRYRATDWKKFMAIWKQIGFNYCIIKNLNNELPKRGRCKPKIRLRRNLAIYRLYRYQNIPMKLLIEISSLSSGSVKRIIGEVFKMLCIADKNCVFRTCLEERS